jgi:hypothetical protein
MVLQMRRNWRRENEDGGLRFANPPYKLRSRTRRRGFGCFVDFDLVVLVMTTIISKQWPGFNIRAMTRMASGGRLLICYAAHKD